MKRIIMTIASALAVLAISSGCVTQQEFTRYQEKVALQLEVLACESKVDAYEAGVKSDEPDPIRRDEPLSIRHDEPDAIRRDLEACQEEFDSVVGGSSGSNYAVCKPKLPLCRNNSDNTNAECNACYSHCLAKTGGDGTWDEAACPLQN